MQSLKHPNCTMAKSTNNSTATLTTSKQLMRTDSQQQALMLGWGERNEDSNKNNSNESGSHLDTTLDDMIKQNKKKALKITEDSLAKKRKL